MDKGDLPILSLKFIFSKFNLYVKSYVLYKFNNSNDKHQISEHNLLIPLNVFKFLFKNAISFRISVYNILLQKILFILVINT